MAFTGSMSVALPFHGILTYIIPHYLCFREELLPPSCIPGDWHPKPGVTHLADPR